MTQAETELRSEREIEVLQKLATDAPTAKHHRSIGRLLTDWKFAARAVRHLLGLPMKMETEDRRVLEEIILPHFQKNPEIRSVLDIGCDWYTRHYQRTFFAGHDYWSMDPVPGQRKFGGQQHITAPMEDIAEHFPEGRFDLIICNGVYGYGLNTPEQCQKAFDACHSRLADGGQLIVGWDDLPTRQPVPFDRIESLQRFAKAEFPLLGSWRYLTSTAYRHTYDFYRKCQGNRRARTRDHWFDNPQIGRARRIRTCGGGSDIGSLLAGFG